MNTGLSTREISDPSRLVRSPLVSVYMLTYLHRPFIEQAVASVVSQECDFEFELIIGEDHSPDGTLEIVKALQAQHPSIIRILTADTNVGAKVNAARCQSAARGRYVAICEGDDYWTDATKLARQVEIFHQNPQCSLVFHSARLVDAKNGKFIGFSRWSRRSRRFLTDELVLGDGGMIPTASMMLRKDVFAARPTWALEAPVGDYPLVLTAALSGDVEYIDRCMSVYRTNVPHSWTSRHHDTLAHRLQYAMRIDAMLCGFAADASHAAASAQRMISKYYSDAIVLSAGTTRERRDAYAAHAGRTRGLDRTFAWLAANVRLRLPRLKIAMRKARTALRLLSARVRYSLRA